MTARLRQIAVHVEEPEDGHYVWVLTERGDGDTWPEIDRGVKSSTTFKKAMADGLVELQALVQDLEIGPRHPDKEGPSDSRHERSALRKSRKVEEEAPPKRPSLFGFGPAR